MFMCAVCHARESREELVEEVFRIDGKYVLVGSVPAVASKLSAVKQRKRSG